MTTKNIEELMLDAEEAVEPGDMEPTVDLEGGLSGRLSLEGTGWVKVWDMRNGEQSIVPAHPDYLRTQLQKTDTDPQSSWYGKRVFTTVKPAVEPFRGSEVCPLHRDHPDFARNQSMGFPVCNKSNLTSQAEAERHLRLKHRDTYETIERLRQREIEQEERELRRLNIESLMRMAGPVAPAEVEPKADVPVEAPVETVTETCECGTVLEAKSAGGMNLKRMHHRKKCPVYKQ